MIISVFSGQKSGSQKQMTNQESTHHYDESIQEFLLVLVIFKVHGGF
jgi:hypothetical protein